MLRRVLKVILVSTAAVLLSGCATRSEPAPVESVYKGRTVYDYEAGSLSSETYIVQPGETLYSIAFRANTDLRQIATLNNLQEPYTIFPGQVLKLRTNSSKAPNSAAVTGPNGPNNRQIGPNNRKDSKINDLNRDVASTRGGEYVEPEPVQRVTDSRSAESSGEITWLWPSQGRIAQRFSDDEPGRKGLVFTGQKGDPVTAAAAGKVVYVGSALRGFGRLIILKHSDDYITAYAHNDELLVQEQEIVDAGQQIATMGDSEADSVRLRFELRYRGTSINPERYLPRAR